MPLPRYQAGPSESKGSRVWATLVGGAIVIGLMIYLASTVRGPDRLGAVVLVATGIFVMIIFAAFALRYGKHKRPTKAPKPTPTSVTPPAAQEPRQP